jgi:hypothetical protein
MIDLSKYKCGIKAPFITDMLNSKVHNYMMLVEGGITMHNMKDLSYLKLPEDVVKIINDKTIKYTECSKDQSILTNAGITYHTWAVYNRVIGSENVDIPENFNSLLFINLREYFNFNVWLTLYALEMLVAKDNDRAIIPRVNLDLIHENMFAFGDLECLTTDISGTLINMERRYLNMSKTYSYGKGWANRMMAYRHYLVETYYTDSSESNNTDTDIMEYLTRNWPQTNTNNRMN